MAWEREGVDEEWKAQWEARQRAARATYVVDDAYVMNAPANSLRFLRGYSRGRMLSVRGRGTLTAVIEGGLRNTQV